MNNLLNHLINKSIFSGLLGIEKLVVVNLNTDSGQFKYR